MKTIQDLYTRLFATSERVSWSSWVAILIFALVLTKDILVSGFEVIPVRSLLNRQISWFLIVPLSLIGAVLAIQEIRKAYLRKEKNGAAIFTINLLLSTPILLYIVFAVLFL